MTISPASSLLALAFQQPQWLWLLLLVPCLFLIFRHAKRERQKTLASLLGPNALDYLSARSHRRWRELWMLLGLVLLILASARPWWRKQPAEASAGGRDVLFLLDVSRSMLAADLAPNRLENARLAIYDCLERLKGNRVALVTFAGSSRIECPFTTDYGFFRERLAEAGPDNVAHGGTRIGDALSKAIDKIIEEERRGLQDIVLLSDGGDQESNPTDSAAALGELDVHFVVVGLGDSVTGARIPARTTSELSRGLAAQTRFTMHEGKEIWSRQESSTLATLAKACPLGVFLNAGTRPLDLGSVYLDLAKHFESTGLVANESLHKPREEFPWFLGASLAALLLARARQPFAGRDHPRHPSVAAYVGSAVTQSPASRGATILPLMLGLALLSLGATPPTSTAEGPVSQGEAGGQEAEPEIPADPILAFIEGCARYEDRNYAGAADCFRGAINRLGPDPLRGPAAGNLGRSLYRQGENLRMIDPSLAADLFLRSADTFRSRLDWDPAHTESSVALELARRQARACEEQLRRAQEGEDPAEEGEESEEPEEGDPSAEGEESDEEGDYEEGESEGEAESSNQSSDQNSIDLDALNIPPPTLNPEDIFREQAEKDAAREKKGPGKYQAVERDW